MKREILTTPLSRCQLRAELSHYVEFWTAKGETTCSVLFGAAWGNDYYPGNEWLEERVPFSSLDAKVEQVEAAGLGRLGSDDLFLTISGIEFLFCNDSDIHLFFSTPHPDTEHFFQRWKQLGFNPLEWLKAGGAGPGEKIRDG